MRRELTKMIPTRARAGGGIHFLGLLGVAAGVWLSVSPGAKAGWLVSPGARWGSFSPRAQDGEPTPNYHGVGGTLSVGYSVQQVWDLAAFGHYSPASLKHGRLGRDDALWVFYGGETGFRIGHSLYLGLRGGPLSYRLLHAAENPPGPELPGHWRGTGGGFSFGVIQEMSDESQFQASFDLTHGVLSHEKDSSLGKRRFDMFAISLAYVFNSDSRNVLGDSIVGDFLDSRLFD